MKEFSSTTRKVLAIFAAVMAWCVMGAIVVWFLGTMGLVRVGFKFAIMDIAALAIAVWAAVNFVKGGDKEPK